MKPTQSMTELQLTYDPVEGCWRIWTAKPVRRRVSRASRVNVFEGSCMVLTLPSTPEIKELYTGGWPCPAPHHLFRKAGINLSEVIVKP